MNPCKSKQEYLDQVIEPARRVCKRYGYLPSVLIAQACLENGYGMDPSCNPLIAINNMVGQKSELLNSSWVTQGYSVWKGQSITKRTPEQRGGQIIYINDQFRVFDSVEQSLADFLLFLTYGSNYGAGGAPKYGGEVLAIKDPETLIRAVAGRGYATGQTYPTSVMRIVRENNLTQYDDLTTVEPTDQIPPALRKDPEEKIVINQNPLGVRTHNTSKRTGPIEFICIHYVGALGDAKNNIDYYNQTSVTDASADFYCGHNGDIWQYNVKPLERYCWAVGGGRQSQYGGTYFGICKNANSISIEMCVKSKTGKAPKYPNDPAWYFTDATVAACVKLTKYLMKLYGIDRTHVIRHFDVNGKYCPGVVGWNGPSGSDADWLAFKDLLAGVTPTPTPTPTPGKNYRVRVGIYEKAYYLERLRNRIKNKTGLDCFTEQKSDGTHIYCGSFGNKANADARAQLLRNAGFDTAIEEA